MDNPIQIIISALTLLGLGGVVGGYVTYLLDRKKRYVSPQMRQMVGKLTRGHHREG
jgi:hypothetical protein